MAVGVLVEHYRIATGCCCFLNRAKMNNSHGYLIRNADVNGMELCSK